MVKTKITFSPSCRFQTLPTTTIVSFLRALDSHFLSYLITTIFSPASAPSRPCMYITRPVPLPPAAFIITHPLISSFENVHILRLINSISQNVYLPNFFLLFILSFVYLMCFGSPARCWGDTISKPETQVSAWSFCIYKSKRLFVYFSPKSRFKIF